MTTVCVNYIDISDDISRLQPFIEKIFLSRKEKKKKKKKKKKSTFPYF